MTSIYDEILRKYKIPKKQLSLILEDPMEAYRKIHRKKRGIIEIAKLYNDLVQKKGTERAKKRMSEFLKLKEGGENY